MNTNKRTLLILQGILTVFAISCDRKIDPFQNIEQNLANMVQGTYEGQVTNSQTNLSRPATITVTSQNDSLIAMHCVADDFDSTVMLKLYQDNDSVMVCSTGQDFYNQYGKYMDDRDFCMSKDNKWMGDKWNHNSGNKNNTWNAWENHMNTQHDANDQHFGGFDVKNQSCSYTFSIDKHNERYSESFTGMKRQ